MVQDNEQPEVDDEAGEVARNPNVNIDEPIYEVDDEAVSAVVRKPTKTAGDLSQLAEASAGITTEDLARDLEAVASKQGAPTDRGLLGDLLERVRRIEEHLGLTS
jgi:hypothetical protein